MLLKALEFFQLGATYGTLGFKIQLKYLRDFILLTGGVLYISMFFTQVSRFISLKFSRFYYVTRFFHALNLLIVTFAFLLVTWKLYIGLNHISKTYDFVGLFSPLQTKLLGLRSKDNLLSINGGMLGDIVLFLGYFSGMIATYMYVRKNWGWPGRRFSKYHFLTSFIESSEYFIYAYMILGCLVTSVNLFVMFASFELLFYFSLYLGFKHDEELKLFKVLFPFLVSGLVGSAFIFGCLAYFKFQVGTLDFFILHLLHFSVWEKFTLGGCIVIGFVTKIPFYFNHRLWIEFNKLAPEGISLFVKGFIVKGGVYCFFFFSHIVYDESTYSLGAALMLSGLFKLNEKMLEDLTFKELICVAVTQEHYIILMLCTELSGIAPFGLMVFLLVQGLTSILMSFLSFLLRRSYNVWNIMTYEGLLTSQITARVSFWLVFILFAGFPLTVKFSMEMMLMEVISMMVDPHLGLFLFIVRYFNALEFATKLFDALKNMPPREKTCDVVPPMKGRYILYLLCILIIYLNLISLFLPT